MICHHCLKPLSRNDAHDLRVMRPIHRECYAARLREPPKPMSEPGRFLPSIVRTMLDRQ